MINLLRAEWKKTIWNYKLTGFLVWGFPVGVLGFYAVMLLTGLFSREAMEGMVATGSGDWTVDALGPWGVILAFPFAILSRMIPLAFMAAVFAGEYQSGLWKYLIPRSRRAFLILSKMAVVVALLALALAATSAVVVAGQGIGRKLTGLAFGPALSGEVLGDFAVRYGQTLLLGVLALILLAAIAALAAILTRSVLGSLLVVFLFSTLDSLSMYILMLLAKIFSVPGIVDLYRYTPQCNFENAQSWFTTGAAIRLPLESFSTGPDLAFSLAMLVIWVAVLTALVLAVFERQDITA
jgi:ABC-type transport system involved in multi-copper enzyme maturation permease subunit